jgi:hypothetical protein
MISLQTLMPYFTIAGTVLVIANVIWAYKDAKERGSSGILIALLVLWMFPLGVILWLIFRPGIVSDLAQQEIGADADADIKERANAGLL